MKQKPKVRTPGLTASGAIPRQVLNADTLPDSALLPLSAVENLFGINTSTVWRWSRSGILHPVRVGNTTRWPLGHLREVIHDGMHKNSRPRRKKHELKNDP